MSIQKCIPSHLLACVVYYASPTSAVVFSAARKLNPPKATPIANDRESVFPCRLDIPLDTGSADEMMKTPTTRVEADGALTSPTSEYSPKSQRDGRRD